MASLGLTKACAILKVSWKPHEKVHCEWNVNRYRLTFMNIWIYTSHKLSYIRVLFDAPVLNIHIWVTVVVSMCKHNRTNGKRC